MQTISINFNVPQGWHELDDAQLRYVYSLIAKEFSADEIKTLALLHFSGCKVMNISLVVSFLTPTNYHNFELLNFSTLNYKPRHRRIKTVFLAMRHAIDDMNARNERMEIMRELFRQMMIAKGRFFCNQIHHNAFIVKTLMEIFTSKNFKKILPK